MLHRRGDIVYSCLKDVARGAKLELCRDDLGKRARQNVGAVFEIDAILGEQKGRARIVELEKMIKVREEARRFFERVRVRRGARCERHTDDGNALSDGRVQLQQTVRPRDNIGRLHDDQDIAVQNMRRELREVAQVVRVEKDAAPCPPLQFGLQPASLRG